MPLDKSRYLVRNQIHRHRSWECKVADKDDLGDMEKDDGKKRRES